MTASVQHEPLQSVQAVRLIADDRAPHADRVIVEAPIALLYNGESFVVMMATPESLEDFALGFALSEGIVGAASEFRLVDIVRHADGIALHAAIPQARFDALSERRRGLEGRSGCGLCGVESLQAALRPVPRVDSTSRVDVEAIRAALHALAAQQPLNASSG